MPIPILQCGDCKFNLKWEIIEENFPGVYVCEKYPKGIPDYVEEGSEDCLEFERMNNID